MLHTFCRTLNSMQYIGYDLKSYDFKSRLQSMQHDI